jgi:hypothetical protein
MYPAPPLRLFGGQKRQIAQICGSRRMPTAYLWGLFLTRRLGPRTIDLESAAFLFHINGTTQNQRVTASRVF